MATLPVKQGPKIGQQAYSADSHTLGTPAKSPRSGKDLYGARHCPVIVQRFAHTHKHRSRQFPGLRDADELVEDVGGAQVSVPALTSGHAETAAHTAAGLRTDAEGTPVLVRDYNCLHGRILPYPRVLAADREQVLGRTVGRQGAAYRGGGSQVEAGGEGSSGVLAYIGHLVEGMHLLSVHPAGKLVTHERLETALCCGLPQFFQSFTKQLLFHMAKLRKKSIYLRCPTRAPEQTCKTIIKTKELWLKNQ